MQSTWQQQIYSPVLGVLYECISYLFYNHSNFFAVLNASLIRWTIKQRVNHILYIYTSDISYLSVILTAGDSNLKPKNNRSVLQMQYFVRRLAGLRRLVCAYSRSSYTCHALPKLRWGLQVSRLDTGHRGSVRTTVCTQPSKKNHQKATSFKYNPNLRVLFRKPIEHGKQTTKGKAIIPI